MTWDEMDAVTVGGGVLPDLPQDQGGLVYEPMSCSDFGWRKCGDWDDGGAAGP